MLPLAATLFVVWDMACHSRKADVCLNCQKETKTTLWEVEGWVKKKYCPSFRSQEEKKKKEVALGCLCRYGRRVAISVELLENIKISKLGMMGSI